MLGQRLDVIREVLITEAGADLAEGLVLVTLAVVAAQQEASVHAGAFPTAEVPSQHHRVDGITHTLQVVFLQLERYYLTIYTFSQCRIYA